MEGGRCLGCKHFIFDPERGHWQTEEGGYGECTHPRASKEHQYVAFYSKCEYFETKVVVGRDESPTLESKGR